MVADSLINAITSVLGKIETVTGSHHAMVGLDGFIDKIQHPVKTQDQSGSTYFKSLDSFGQRIKEASEQSAQIELHTSTIKLGGNAPIFGNALASLGIVNICLGTFGQPRIHPVFQQINPRCELISLGDAAETNALEFNDGKLILSELSVFRQLNWEKVSSQIDLDYLAEQAFRADLIGLVDWCNLPHASDIWLGLFNDIVQPHVTGKPRFFFDLADPSKKTTAQVKEVVNIINAFADYGEVTLGLNENETKRLAGFLGLVLDEKDDTDSLSILGQKLFDLVTLDRLLIHPIDGCYSITKDGPHYLEGRVVDRPTVSTGGGDNFNAGFCFGLLNGFSDEEAMVCAMATSGAYVQNGNSPNLEAIRLYLSQWLDEL